MNRRLRSLIDCLEVRQREFSHAWSGVFCLDVRDRARRGFRRFWKGPRGFPTLPFRGGTDCEPSAGFPGSGIRGDGPERFSPVHGQRDSRGTAVARRPGISPNAGGQRYPWPSFGDQPRYRSRDSSSGSPAVPRAKWPGHEPSLAAGDHRLARSRASRLLVQPDRAGEQTI